MSRRKKAVLFSIVWIGLSIGAGILHTDVALAGRITPEQDATISYRYGVACGLGLLAIWGIFLYRARADLRPSPTTTKSTPLVQLVVLVAAAAAFGLYSFVGQVRQTRVRAIAQGIHAAFENPQKLPPGHERGQDALRRLKAIDTSYAPPEMKQALADYITIFQRVIDDMEAGRDLSADTKASDEVTNRINALQRKYN